MTASGETQGAVLLPRRADAMRNRALLLETARGMLSVQGISVSFDDIAQRAGVGVGTVYRHFPTRADLLRAVFSRGLVWMTERADELLRAEDPGRAFMTLFRELVDAAAVNKAVCESVDVEDQQRLIPDPEANRAFEAALGALLARAQRAGQIRGELDVADVRALVLGAATASRAREGVRSVRLVDLVAGALVCDESTLGGGERYETPGVSRLSGLSDLPSLPDLLSLRCAECGTPLHASPTGRPALYCGASCRQRAYRKRSGK
ncbi:TetR/AcrR family transcriptional regulator [Catenulispora rubra]|uniref:TetR/AcrR family transcriptional regulator n=1 Tax=Catenulispora rubra TaxID=280293 RepID=UPI00189238ED|nr:TetR/AcrR family transcriptional regulator [Catenulispora rubra]